MPDITARRVAYRRSCGVPQQSEDRARPQLPRGRLIFALDADREPKANVGHGGDFDGRHVPGGRRDWRS